MKILQRTAPTLAALALLVAACGPDLPEEGLVARAGDYTFTVDQATDLLVDQENLPNQTQVVEALAELWVDYALLASAVAQDTTLGFLDLEPMISAQLDQQMIFQLRDSVIQVDTAIADDELRSMYEAEAPGAQFRARHILFGFPQEATQADRDAIRAQAEEVRQRAVSGASFEALAREFSQDPGTASQGGDLGFVGRGELVRPIDEALFAMEPDEISEVVESPFGFHILKLEERRTPGFDEARAQFRIQAQNRRYLQAESVFVAGVEERATPEVAEGAFDLIRSLANEPARRISGRAGRRPLMTYTGGTYTAAAFQKFVQSRPAQERAQIGQATDEQLDNFLRGLVQRELLVQEARAAGLASSQATVDSLTELTRQRVKEVADQIGLLRLDRAPGEALAPAVNRAVNQALLDILTGAADVVPLGQIAFQLRERRPTAIYEAGVGQVVLDIGRARAARSPSPVEDAVPGDSTGNAPAN